MCVLPKKFTLTTFQYHIKCLKIVSTYEKSDFYKTVFWTSRWSSDLYIGFNYKGLLIRVTKENKNVLFIF